MYSIIEELLVLARQGDVDSKEQLLSKLYPLIISSINRYYLNSNDYEDLIQDGNIVILECIENYDISRKVYFLGYVKTMLKYNYLQNHRLKQHLSLNTPIGDEDDNEMIDLLVSDDEDLVDSLIKWEEMKTVMAGLSLLTDRQREVIIYFYVEGLSIGMIAKRLGISYRTVVNTKTVALEKMKKQVIGKV